MHEHGSEADEGLYLRTVRSASAPVCACGCGGAVAWAGWKKGYVSRFIRGHNANVDSVYKDPERQRGFVQKRLDGFKTGRIKAWNAGLKNTRTGDVVSAAPTLVESPSPPVACLHATGPQRSTVTTTIRDPSSRMDSRVTGPTSFDLGSALNAQSEIYDFVRSLAPDAVLSDRTVIAPKELDVYVPSRKFAVEYDGLYWHSGPRAVPKRTVDKQRACDAAGIDVLRVFEDEWRDKRAIVERMIKHRLGQEPKLVGARQCKVEQLTPAARRQFFDDHHIDGDTRATVAWGLVHEGKILAAMSLRRPFHRGNADHYEVSRFATAGNVPGSLSRLSRRALAWAKASGALGLMTYVDRRIGSGKGYLAAGFEVLRETAPRFWWTDSVHRYDRFRYKADPSRGLTQQQVADEAGVEMIFGCGNLVLGLI